MPYSTFSRALLWRALFGLAIVPILASCNDDDESYCYNCIETPFEISLGVVTGDFNSNGFAKRHRAQRH